MSKVHVIPINEQAVTLLMENGPGNMDVKAFIMQRDNSYPPRIMVAYQQMDYEGNEIDAGMENEEGFSMLGDDEEDTVTKAYEFLRNQGASEASASFFHTGIWYSTGYSSNSRTGVQTERTFHLKGFTADQEKEVYDLWHGVTNS